MKYWFRKTLKHYLMLLPFFFFFALFFIYPIVKGFSISFYKWDSVNPAVFVNSLKEPCSNFFHSAYYNAAHLLCKKTTEEMGLVRFSGS